MASDERPSEQRVEPHFESGTPAARTEGAAPEAAPKKPANTRGKVLGALVALATVGGFTGIAWYATTQGQRDPSAVVPVIRADQSPVKVLPDEPGGMDVPNRDKLVFMQIDPDAKEPEVERLLPPPELPMDRPAPPAETVEVPPTGPLVPDAPEIGREAAEAAPPMPTSEVQSDAAKTEPEPAAEAPPKEPEVAAIPAPPKEAPERMDREAMAAAAAAAAAPPEEGGYHVQLGALRDEARANSEAARLSQAHSEVLGSLTIATVKADLGSRGIFYRLRAGPLADRDAAEAMCRAFADRKVNCIVISP